MLSIVLPVKDEPNLDGLLTQISRSFKNTEHEVLIQREQGFSNAVKAGITNAKGEYIAVMDADGAHKPEDLHNMYKLLRIHRKTIAIAVRDRHKQPFTRRLATSFFGWLAQNQLHIKMSDSMSTFLVGKREAMKFTDTNHPKFTLEILQNTPNTQIIEYPIVEERRLGGKSKTGITEATNLFTGLVDINKLITYGLILFAFLFSLTLTTAYIYPVGWDWHFHRNIAEIYAHGQLGMFSSYVLDMIHYPYPPLFHLLLTPSVMLGAGHLFGRTLQLFLYPLGLLSCAFLVRKAHSPTASTLTVVTLMGSLAYFDRLFQPIPQALDMILFPLAVLLYLKNRKLPFVLLSTLMIYNHGFASLALLGGIMLHALFSGRKKEVLAVAGLSLPIIVPSIVYIVSGWGFWGANVANTPQEVWFWTSPLSFSVWYLGVAVLGFVAAIILLAKKRYNNLGILQKLSILTLACLVPMIAPWPDRFLTYASIPLGILLATAIAEIKSRRVLYPFLFVGWLAFQLVLWSWLFTDNFYVVARI